jgi:hypothetical protein
MEQPKGVRPRVGLWTPRLYKSGGSRNHRVGNGGQGCKPASRIDHRPASNVDHAKKRQAHGSDREMSLAPWSVFDARWAKILVKLQRLFTCQPSAGPACRGIPARHHVESRPDMPWNPQIFSSSESRVRYEKAEDRGRVSAETTEPLRPTEPIANPHGSMGGSRRATPDPCQRVAPGRTELEPNGQPPTNAASTPSAWPISTRRLSSVCRLAP